MILGKSISVSSGPPRSKHQDEIKHARDLLGKNPKKDQGEDSEVHMESL